MQKIICISQSGSENAKLEKYLEEGWTVKEMKTAGSYSMVCCFVLIEKNNRNKTND